MIKVEFSDIYLMFVAISRLRPLRQIYQRDFEIEDVYLYGENGLFSNLSQLERFYSLYLKGLTTFDNMHEAVDAAIKEISQDDIDQGKINKKKYRQQLLTIVSNVEQFETNVVQYFSRTTMLQFFNVTFQSDTLFFYVHNIFPSDVWTFIPDEAKDDIREGSKALLFGLPTCSSFMFLRALERCLRKLCVIIDTKCDESKLTFGGALQLLSNKLPKFEGEDLVRERQFQLLSYIKDEFRNPAAHPEKKFNIYEAEQLFQVVNIAITRVFQLYSLSTAHNSGTKGD